MTDTTCPPPVSRPVDHEVTVVGARWTTPLTRSLVFAAEGLAAAFATPPGAYAPYLKLVLGPPEAPLLRTYSIRHLDTARDELCIEFVFHETDGPGSAFGRTAREGSAARLRGPGHLGIARCARCCLVADHCGIPALAHLLEHLPEETVGTALIEVPDASEIRSLAAPRGVEIEWLVRVEGEPGRLAERVARFEPGGGDETLLWAGAEATIARAVRRTGRTQWALPPSQCQVLNYWRAGRSEGSFSFIA